MLKVILCDYAIDDISMHTVKGASLYLVHNGHHTNQADIRTVQGIRRCHYYDRQ